MTWFRFRNVAERASQTEAWTGPFAPAPPTGSAKFDPMVRTAAQLAASPVEGVSSPAPATSVAA
jgi:hypothetical protein